MSPQQQVEQHAELVAWLRAIVVHGSHPGSRRARPVSWWLTHASAFLRRPVTAAEFRRATKEAGVRLGPDGEATDILARESLTRAARVFAGRYTVDADGLVVIRDEAGKGDDQ